MPIEQQFNPNVINQNKTEKGENKMEKERRIRIEQILEKYGLKALNKVRMQREIKDEGIRFFHVLAEDQAGDKRFVKMLADLENEEARRAIVREVAAHRNISAQLKNKPDSKMKARDFRGGQADIEQGEGYLVADSFSEQAKIGFIESEADMEKLTAEHGRKCAENLLAMQKDIDANQLIADIKREFHLQSMEDVYEILEDYYDSFDGYKENTLVIMSMLEPELPSDMDEDEREGEIARSLENHGNPEDMNELLKNIPPEYEKYLNRDNDEFGTMPLWMIMERRLGAKDFRKSVNELFDKYEETIKTFQQEDKYFLVHGDCCLNNTFYSDSGEVEFTDWGHAGITKNELLSLIHDFGNMRARAWNNKEYREAMDNAILEHYKSLGQEEAGKAVVALGILRSHCCLAGFFENYDITKQRMEQEKKRKENTEQDARKAFAIAGISLI
jgi:hypothetical protein